MKDKRVGRQMIYRSPNGVHWNRVGQGRELWEAQVRVMAVAENWAMVRRPRAMPFVVPVKDLHDIQEDGH